MALARALPVSPNLRRANEWTRAERALDRFADGPTGVISGWESLGDPD
jgi:hypothetical protein